MELFFNLFPRPLFFFCVLVLFSVLFWASFFDWLYQLLESYFPVLFLGAG